MSFVRFTLMTGKPVFANRKHIIAIEDTNILTTVYLTNSGSTGRNLAYQIRENQELAAALARGSWIASFKRWLNERSQGTLVL